MMSLDHQLCIGNASKCLKHGIVQEKRKKTAACHPFHSSFVIHLCLFSCCSDDFEKARS